MLRLAPEEHLLLRYEDRSFGDATVPSRLAEVVGLRLPPSVRREIFARYSTEAIRAFAATLAELPPERLVATDQTMVDRVTHIHRTHIGDARSGKWRDLPALAQTELTRIFTPFLERFGYLR